MQRPLLLILVILCFTYNTTAQVRIISGKVIDKYFNPVLGTLIQSSDTTLQTTYDINGKFRVSVPVRTKSLIFKCVGFEPAFINLSDSCNELEVILLLSGSYDFKSLKKINKLRMKEFKKLPELHLTAFKRGIFQNSSACYTRNFISNLYKNK